jgi:hypothetical protein
MKNNYYFNENIFDWDQDQLGLYFSPINTKPRKTNKKIQH